MHGMTSQIDQLHCVVADNLVSIIKSNILLTLKKNQFLMKYLLFFKKINIRPYSLTKFSDKLLLIIKFYTLKICDNYVNGQYMILYTKRHV